MNKYEKDNIARLRPLLPECTVLLKKNGAFPLDGPCRIAAVGAGARYTVKGGTGSGEVNSRYFVSIEDGLKDAGFDVVSRDWATFYGYYRDEAKTNFIKEIKEKSKRDKTNIISASMGTVMREPEYIIALPKDCDAAVYVVSRISGEGNDRQFNKGDFMLTDSEVRDILELNDRYDKFLLVINSGGPVDLTPVLEVGNILVLSQLGVETGAVLADLLLGKSYPSGKLATTWAKSWNYCGIGTFGERDDTFYQEGIYVGYRWFDASGAEALFPFGHGLGYTDFILSAGDVGVDGSEVTVNIKVTNTGSFRGKEAPQVYVSCPSGRLDREVKSLVGFAKSPELEPGKSCKVPVSFDMKDLAGYDAATESWILEHGKYVILAGSSSAEVFPVCVLSLEEDVTVRKARNLFGDVPFEDWKNSWKDPFDPSGLKVYTLDPSALKDERPAGRETADISFDFSGFSVKELAILSVGAFDPNKSLSSVVGDSSTSVAGAAGESSKLFADRGIAGITMADGPAGVRISSKYYEDKNGKHSLTSPVPESITDMLPASVKYIINKSQRVPRKAVVREQYCTAIPIATAIAQSFNTGLAEECGDIVGSEMDIFGVDLWLAPALNIHRSVLCGRNFEYYSEDPLLSGKFAAAITRGVQQHPGRGVTIKHFAANNQETNRYANNSVISERALREIYLKGFGICIRESDPMALMTSYNLLNGEHTSESRSLTTDILRDEFGFDGLVMTDWVIGNGILLAKDSKYGVPDPAFVADAGCSLFMPGSKKDFKDIMTGLKEGKVTRKQLEINAGWIVRVNDRLGK